jgi:large subunit ribosomal protein L36
MKIRSTLKRICPSCKLVRRGRKQFVICAANARHKQRQGFHTLTDAALAAASSPLVAVAAGVPAAVSGPLAGFYAGAPLVAAMPALGLRLRGEGAAADALAALQALGSADADDEDL